LKECTKTFFAIEKKQVYILPLQECHMSIPLLFRISTTDELRFPFPRKRAYDEAVVSFEEFSIDGKPKRIRLIGPRANGMLAQHDGV